MAKLAATQSFRRRALARLALVAPVVLAALAISGCGGSSDPSRLHSAGEHRLLALLDRARTEVAAHSKAGVDAALARFIGDVKSLRGSGELTTSTAAALDRQALATEAQASRQLSSTSTPSGTPVGDVKTTTTRPTQPHPPHGKPHPGKDGAPGPPGHAKGKHHKGSQGPGDGQQVGGNGDGSGDGDS